MYPSTAVARSNGLDELVIEALATHAPVARPSNSYVDIEIVWDDEAPEDFAVTNRFVRFSAPYERVDIEPLSSLTSLRRARPTRFVTTVRNVPRSPLASATLSFDKVWFDQPEETLATIEDVSVARANSWLWLGISLLVAALAVGFVQYAL